jgi:hypothetical protein
MAAFTTISVLGGSNGLSQWMKDKEDDLENLSQQSLPEPKENEEIMTRDEEKLIIKKKVLILFLRMKKTMKDQE